MRIRTRDTGEVMFLDEFLRTFSSTNFERPIAPELIDELGADPVLEGPQPTLTENQYARYDGVEEINGQWFTKYVAVNYTEEELAAQVAQWRQSASCTPFQGRMALSEAGLLSQVETAISAADEKTKLAWEYALVWHRNSPMIESLMAALNISAVEADNLIKAAQQITA